MSLLCQNMKQYLKEAEYCTPTFKLQTSETYLVSSHHTGKSIYRLNSVSWFGFLSLLSDTYIY